MSDDNEETMVLFPAGTHFFEPDAINRVILMFPDANSAVLFFEWCREQVIRAERENGR